MATKQSQNSTPTRKQVEEALRTQYLAATAGEKSAIRKVAEDQLGKAESDRILGRSSGKQAKTQAVSAAESLLASLAS